MTPYDANEKSVPLQFPIKAVFISLCTGPPQTTVPGSTAEAHAIRAPVITCPTPPLQGQSRGFPVRGAGIKRLMIVIASQTKPGLASELQRAVPTEEAERHLGLTSSAQLR